MLVPQCDRVLIWLYTFLKDRFLVHCPIKLPPTGSPFSKASATSTSAALCAASAKGRARSTRACHASHPVARCCQDPRFRPIPDRANVVISKGISDFVWNCELYKCLKCLRIGWSSCELRCCLQVREAQGLLQSPQAQKFSETCCLDQGGCRDGADCQLCAAAKTCQDRASGLPASTAQSAQKAAKNRKLWKHRNRT